MAEVSLAPGLPYSSIDSSPQTHSLADSRSPHSSTESFRSSSTTIHRPDLSTDEAALSNKLIHAINQQTYLDDTLSATRHELQVSQEQVRQLEATLQEYKSRELTSNGVLRKRVDVEDNTLKLEAKLANEKKQRDVVEQDKKSIELELETLTVALFEEANLVFFYLMNVHRSCIQLIQSRWLQRRVKSERRLKSEVSEWQSSYKTPSSFSLLSKSSCLN